MRKYFFAGNWKMNKTPSEAGQYASQLAGLLKDVKHRTLLAPAFVAIPAVAAALKHSSILVGAQNMSQAESGAYTGEVSPAMLLDIGVDVVIIGHSERRSIFVENDELINSKVKLALAKDLEVILCVGETLEEREGGMLENVIKRQLGAGLKDVDDLSGVTIAYEPVWAIGTGKTATPKDANEVHAFIRRILAVAYSQQTADAIIIQYGGSVKPSNVRELMAMENIDGALVGGASLNANDFVAIANFDA